MLDLLWNLVQWEVSSAAGKAQLVEHRPPEPTFLAGSPMKGV
jgi:hypothetical protein